MKAQRLTGIRQMEPFEVPVPKLAGPNDVLLKIKYIGVCRSDVHYYETGCIGSQVVQYPFTVGHECSAIVEDFGSAVTHLQKGEPVVVEPGVSCWQCVQCRSGRPHTCENLKFLGCPGQIEGCLSEYLVMPSECCFPTKDRIALEQGTLCEPFAIGLYAVQRSGLSSGQTVVILGAGPIGLSCLAAAQTQVASKIFVTEKIPERMCVAQKAGAVWVGSPDSQDVVEEICLFEPEGIDIAYECAGQQETVNQAIEVLKPGGTLMLIGIPREERISFSPDLIRRKEISIINVRRQNHCTAKAIDLIADRKVDLDFMITHRFNFDQTKEAFDLVAGYKEGVIKALISL